MTHLRDLNPKVITELTNRDFSCRLVKDEDEDIIKALECIFSHYKYDYLHQALYDHVRKTVAFYDVDREIWPDIRACEGMIRSGELLEIVKKYLPNFE